MDMNCADPTVYCIGVCTESRTKQTSSTFRLFIERSVNKSPLIAENVSPVILPAIPFVLNHGMLGDLYVRDEIGRL